MNVVNKRGPEVNNYRLMLPQVAALVAIGLGGLQAGPFAAAADRAARFCTGRDIACDSGQDHAVQLARRWQPVVEWRFDRDLNNWQIKNYQKALEIEIADELRRVHRAIRDVDPFHVTVQADGVYAGGPRPSRYTDYVDSTDAFLPEIYPIRSDKDCEVANVTRDMKLIADDLRRAGRIAPIWAIIQDFEGWGWQRYPTEAETRVMTYLAIIHGAKGMTYYTYGGTGKNHGVTHDPQVWAALKRISRQLADLHDVLVQRDPPQKQQVQILRGPQTDGLGYPAVSTLLKEHQGWRYLLAANSSRGAVRARINAGVDAGQVQVMFEDRRLTAKAGAWEDDFAPYAVHVYSW